MTNWRLEAFHWVILLGIGATSLLAWPYMPERMPIHWNAAGEVDGHGSKLVGLGLFPALALGLYLLMLFLPRIDPGRANFRNFARPYWIIRLSILLLLALIHGAIVLIALGYQIPMNVIVFLAVGLLLVVIGNYLRKIRPNWIVGVRTPWTLSSKLSWTKTHRQSSWWMIAMGISFGSCAFVASEWYVLAVVCFTLAATAWLFIYSYLVWRTDPDRIAPAGVTPAENNLSNGGDR